jgi:hypothetical protein
VSQADQLIVSPDHGRHWTTMLCAGVHAGACPAFIVANVFGAGHSYGFLPDGIYRFNGSGPGIARLAISGQLPLPFAGIGDVEAGNRQGDPIFVAGKVSTKVVYRSLDSGRTWQRLVVAP